MKFDNLKERMLYFRSMTDYKLYPNSYVLVMLDGRAFSKLTKKNYTKPFDIDFVNIMDEVTKYLLKQVGNCKFAYTQSDEITLVLTDFDTITTDSFFGYRLSKILSVLPSIATSKFNQLVALNLLKKCSNIEEANEKISDMDLGEFDCKAWNVPSFNDVYSWLLYRQLDCVRNSKQQAAQTYLPKRSLLNKNTDEQISMLLNEKGIDWHKYDDGLKFGRFIYKEEIDGRTKPIIKNAFELYEEYGREKFEQLNKIPKIE